MKEIDLAKNYDKIASWWNEKHFNSKYGLEALQKAISYSTQFKNALDVGCGSGGRMIHLIAKQGFWVTGIDISKEMLKLAKRNHPEFIFENADILHWKTETKFDLILAWDSIFHLAKEEQNFCIKKLANLLNEEGILLYTFGDAVGNHKDLSFKEHTGKQIHPLENDYFPYGSIGIKGNLFALLENNLKCMHLEIDQYPLAHVYIIAKKEKVISS